MEEERKLPIGVQSFEKLRESGFLYVDKTCYIHALVRSGGQYFLSRPRRFGKSLFLSTLKAYWEGKRELFEGLEIAELEKDKEGAFEPYPVFYFDFNGQNYQARALEDVLDGMLSEWEEIYGCEKKGSLSDRFRKLMKTAREKTGRGCVVLVDEYDKPLLEVLENDSLEEHNKAVFKGFFGTLKSYDEYLRFVFITGVTKFSKVSLFSDLNQLVDISLESGYAGICGITQQEMERVFDPEIAAMAETKRMSRAECLAALQKHYDGYHFYPHGEGVYNPFSLLNSLAFREFRSYWFATGTPTFLVKRVRAIRLNANRFTDRTLYADMDDLTDYRYENPDPIPLLYQTGYLTIWDYDERRQRYTLGFPNREVKYSFLKSLLPDYTPAAIKGRGTDIFALDDCLEAGDTEGTRDILGVSFDGEERKLAEWEVEQRG